MNEWMNEKVSDWVSEWVNQWMNESANIKLTSVNSNDVQLLISVQLFKETKYKRVKICFDWNKCKLLHKQSVSVNRTSSQKQYQGKQIQFWSRA